MVIVGSFIDTLSRSCILLLEDLDATFTYGTTSTGDPTATTEAAADGNGVTLSGLLACLDFIDPAEGGYVRHPTERVLRCFNHSCHLLIDLFSSPPTTLSALTQRCAGLGVWTSASISPT